VKDPGIQRSMRRNLASGHDFTHAAIVAIRLRALAPVGGSRSLQAPEFPHSKHPGLQARAASPPDVDLAFERQRWMLRRFPEPICPDPRGCRAMNSLDCSLFVRYNALLL
jgi:hypothetical protein